LISRYNGGDLDQNLELLRLIESARGRGYEFYQHGFLHFAFECGVPDLGMFTLDPRACREFDVKRAEIEALHTFEALVEMLDNGRRIWRRAFGEDSAGLRPAYGAFCTNLYLALAVLGHEWVSSRIPCMTSFLRSAGQWKALLDFRDGIPSVPQRLPQGLWEFPIAGNYGYRLLNDPARIDSMVALGLEEFEIYADRNAPMLIVSHWHGLQEPRDKGGSFPPRPEGMGYAVHEKLLPALRDTCKARFPRMSELVAEVTAAGFKSHPSESAPEDSRRFLSHSSHSPAHEWRCSGCHCGDPRPILSFPSG